MNAACPCCPASLLSNLLACPLPRRPLACSSCPQVDWLRVVLDEAQSIKNPEAQPPHPCLPCPQVDWLRVVLDEAQSIKNPMTQMAKASHALQAQRRWAVSGTPNQNSLQVWPGLLRCCPALLQSCCRGT